MVRITEEEARRLGIINLVSKSSKSSKPTKYNNVKCEINGIKFDSQKERDYYLTLLELYKRGKIKDLRLQVRINLQEGFTTPEGKRVRAIDYIADFTYIDETGNKHIVDVKGGKATKTAVYKLKKKLLADKGFYIEEV